MLMNFFIKMAYAENSVDFSKNFPFLYTNIADLLSSVLDFVTYGVLVVVVPFMVVYSAFLFVTSAGVEENIKKARKTLKYAVVGAFLVMLLQLLLGGVNDGNFKNVVNNSATFGSDNNYETMEGNSNINGKPVQSNEDPFNNY